MNRTKTIIVTLILCLLTVSIAHAELPRRAYNFNTDWLYCLGDPSGAHKEGFDDSGWEQVGLPHSLTIEPSAYERGGMFYRGPGWYRRHFTLPEQIIKGKRITIEFEAVMTRADVFLNGERLDTHVGGFTPFLVDITDRVRPGERNLLAVRVDNTEQDCPPEGRNVDYALFGGIVRDVRLHVTEPVFIDNVYITTPEVSKVQSLVNLRVKVNNQTAQSRQIQARYSIFRAGERPIEFWGELASVGPDQMVWLPDFEGLVENPELWSPDHPELYHVTFELFDGDGKLLDQVTTRFGIRSIEFTTHGFFLNGEPLKLIGHNRHQMYPHIGNAVPNRYQRFDAEMLKNSGANFVRLSHYIQDTSFLDACDELGIMVFAEPPGWQYIGGPEWKNLAMRDLRVMIERDWNHPSLILWGVRLNETPNDMEFHTSMNNLAKELDPTRPTTGARMAVTGGDYFEEVIAKNDYSGFLMRPGESLPHVLSEHSALSYFIPPDWGEEEMIIYARWHMHINNLIYRTDWTSGGASWCFADYNTFMPFIVCSDCGQRIRDTGVVDLHRIPKAAYYTYAAQQDLKPFVHIVNNWTGESPEDVMVLGNCDEVELKINGESAGRLKPDAEYKVPPNRGYRGHIYRLIARSIADDVRERYPYDGLPHPPFTFTNMKFEPGELIARCYTKDELVAEDKKYTPGEPAAIRLKPDYRTLNADGADITRVVVEIVDHLGMMVPTGSSQVDVIVSGPGRYIGDNPLLTRHGYTAFYVKAGHEQGTINVQAKAEVIEGDTFKITTIPLEIDAIVPRMPALK